MNLSDAPQLSKQLDRVRIVMVNTTLPANIGSALRAMKTMGLSKLVLVAPKTYPHADIDALAAGAQDLIAQLNENEVGDEILIPQNMLRTGEEVFLDDMTLDDVRTAVQAPVTVVGPNGQDLVHAILG